MKAGDTVRLTRKFLQRICKSSNDPYVRRHYAWRGRTPFVIDQVFGDVVKSVDAWHYYSENLELVK